MRLYIDIIVILLGLQVLAASAITCTYKGKTLENLEYAYHENGCTQLQCQFGQMEPVTEACSKEIDGICHPVGAIFDYNKIEYQCLKTEEGGIVSYEIEQLTPVFKPCQAEGKTFQHLQKFMLSDGCILYQCQDGNVTIINPACPKDTNGICHELGYWFEQGGQYYICQNRSENGVEVFENKLLDPQPDVNLLCNRDNGEQYKTFETFLTPNGCREVQCQAGKFAYLTSRCRDDSTDTCRYVGELWDYADDHYECQKVMGSNNLPAWWAREVTKTYLSCWVLETWVPHLNFWQNPSGCIKAQCINGNLTRLEIGCHLSNNECKSKNDMWSVEGIIYKCVVTSTGYRKVVIVDANGNYDDSEPNIVDIGVVFPEFEGCPAVADIIFVMDASRSINPTNFAIQLDFVSNISNYFVIGPNDVQFGAVVFSDIAKKLFDLNDYTTAAEVEQALRETPYLRNITHTEKALNMIIDDGMFEAAAGGRDKADDVVIVLTDGRSEDTPTTLQAADRLKARGVDIIVVGITLLVYDPELQGIATRQENVFRAPGYEVIQSILNAVSRRACDTVNNCKGDPCEHKCTGTDTGFVCSCRDGYVINADNNTRCDDVDECSDPAMSPCDQICTNTEGSFECSCNPGYNVSSSDPVKCEDKNECADTDNPVCEHDCVNTVGGYTCSCQPGYEVSPTDPSKCGDLNECETEAPCQQKCTNTPGSYRCSCETGYVVSSTDPDSCEEIVICKTKADIILVFDASSSIGREDYDKQYVFAKRLIRHFTIGADDVRFASLVFSYSVKILFNLNTYNNYAGLDAALTGVPYESMSTYTHKALKGIIDYKMFDPINGGRADALDVVVLLTDGNANRQSSTVPMANELKAMGVVIMGILIGPDPKPEMFAEIVSSPDDIIPATSYDELDYIEQKVADRTCHDSTTKAPVP